MARLGFFTGKQITAMVLALCAVVVFAPVGVMAATGNLVNITDPTHASYKAHVTSGGALEVAGTVKTTPGGTQPVSGTVTADPGLPATPFTQQLGNGQAFTTPSRKHLVVTSLSVEAIVPQGCPSLNYLAYTSGSSSGIAMVPVTFVETTAGGGTLPAPADWYVGTVNITIYPDEGTTLKLFSSSNETSSCPDSSIVAEIDVSGYLI